MSGRTLPVVAVTLALTLLAGCSQAEKKPTQASAPTPSASVSRSVSSRATSSASVSASPTSTEPASLGGTCDDLLPVTTVGISLGHVVIGLTAFVVGVPEPKIGRLARLNCRYGLAKPVKGKPAPQPQVEIGISLYDSAPRAASRVQATVDDYQSHGARPTDVTVGAFPATVLVGYGSPTIVVAAGPRTVAVTVDSRLVGRSASKGLIAVAALALTTTKKFSQGAPSPTTSTS